MGEHAVTIRSIPDGHVVVGHIAHLKVLDEEGGLYWATRSDGLNDMERYGMALDMVETFRDDLAGGKEGVE